MLKVRRLRLINVVMFSLMVRRCNRDIFNGRPWRYSDDKGVAVQNSMLRVLVKRDVGPSMPNCTVM